MNYWEYTDIQDDIYWKLDPMPVLRCSVDELLEQAYYRWYMGDEHDN